MKVESISLCDKCKQTIKVVECDICNADLCNKCRNDMRSFEDMIQINLCDTCKRNVNAVLRSNYSSNVIAGEELNKFVENERLKEKIVDYIRGLITLKKL